MDNRRGIGQRRIFSNLLYCIYRKYDCRHTTVHNDKNLKEDFMKAIDPFFTNVDEYLQFLLFRSEQRKRDSEFTSFFLLQKEDDRFLYYIELRDPVTKEVFSASEYVRPFDAVQANIDLFNQGVAECARRLQAYIATGQIDGLPAFGILSCDSPDQTAPAPPPYNYVDNHAADEPEINEARQATAPLLFFPSILESKVAKHYKAGVFRVYLVTDVISAGSVPISHMMIAYEGEGESPVYAVAAEYVDQSYRDDGGSHFLCTYNGASHQNLGCKSDWGDINEFERKAYELMVDQLGTMIVAI